MKTMTHKRGCTARICLVVLAGLLAFGTASAQGSGEADKDDDTKTKQARVDQYVELSREKTDKIFVVLAGEGTLLLGEDELPVRPGSVVGRPPGQAIRSP